MKNAKIKPEHKKALMNADISSFIKTMKKYNEGWVDDCFN